MVIIALHFPIRGQPSNPRGLSLLGFRKRVLLLPLVTVKKSDTHGITLSANRHASARVAPLRSPVLWYGQKQCYRNM